MDPSTPRKTFKDLLTPKKRKKCVINQDKTPSRRKMFFASMDIPIPIRDETPIIDDKLHGSVTQCGEDFKSTKNKSLLCNKDLLAGLVCRHGIDSVSRLIGAIRHIPHKYPDRHRYIAKIVNCGEGIDRMTEAEITEYSQLINDTVEPFQLSDDLLWKCTQEHDEGFNVFLMPPVTQCIHCSGTLYTENKCAVTLFTLAGPIPGQKVTMRCKKECGTTFNVDRYNVPHLGTHYYDTPSKFISSSTKVYVTRDVHELICESANHAFVSHHAFTEIYNSLFGSSVNSSRFKLWLSTSKTMEVKDSEEADVLQVNDNGEADTVSDDANRYSLSRKKTANAYFNGELANEVQDRNLQTDLKIAKGESREDVMRKIDILRRQEIYRHENCPPTCQEKGCKTLRVIDGCWKVCMPHCMYAVEMEVEGMPLLNFPNVCTAEPKARSVFCEKHHKLLEENGIPTKKEQFLKHIGCKEKPYSADDVKSVDQKTVELSRKLNALPDKQNVTASDYQGTSDMLARIKPDRWENDKTCNKDTGEKSRLRQRSRGHFICVTGGGHIQYFDPIFKSESPGQVFLIVIRVMRLQLSNIPADKLEEALESFVLSYDNMCQLDSLRASKEPLPFPEPFDLMWHKITKIIDRLHISNHKNPKCHVEYNPSKIPEEHNTMIAEQTFSWFSRFKKIVNSMTQVHHLFYVHRNIQRRNLYTEKCRSAGKEPLLPGINTKVCKVN